MGGERRGAVARRQLKTLMRVARDIYPHDTLADTYYIKAVKPWDAKAAKDPRSRR